jgi:hypothetical protein
MLFLQAALNGDRKHQVVSRSAEKIAQDAKAATNAGARSVNVHVFNDEEAEALNAHACSRVLNAIRVKAASTWCRPCRSVIPRSSDKLRSGSHGRALHNPTVAQAMQRLHVKLDIGLDRHEARGRAAEHTFAPPPVAPFIPPLTWTPPCRNTMNRE